LETDFITSPRTGRVYVQSLPSDNPHLAEAYIEHLRETYEDMPDLLEAYLNGVWGAIGAHDQVFDSQSVTRAMKSIVEPGKPRCWGIDVARFGDDKTVIVERCGRASRFIVEWHHMGDTRQQSNEIVSTIAALRKEERPTLITIDDTGLVGVADNLIHDLRPYGIKVLPVVAAKSAIDDSRYFNARAEILWGLRNQLRDGKIAIPDDEELRTELLAVKYKFRSGRILIEPKDDIKERIGRSPDKLDALALAYIPEHEQIRMFGHHRGKDVSDGMHKQQIEVVDGQLFIKSPFRTKETNTGKQPILRAI